jgi:hypothetical protein
MPIAPSGGRIMNETLPEPVAVDCAEVSGLFDTIANTIVNPSINAAQIK